MCFSSKTSKNLRPKDNEVLMKVHAASANPADWHTMRADTVLSALGQRIFQT